MKSAICCFLLICASLLLRPENADAYPETYPQYYPMIKVPSWKYDIPYINCIMRKLMCGSDKFSDMDRKGLDCSRVEVCKRRAKLRTYPVATQDDHYPRGYVNW